MLYKSNATEFKIYVTYNVYMITVMQINYVQRSRHSEHTDRQTDRQTNHGLELDPPLKSPDKLLTSNWDEFVGQNKRILTYHIMSEIYSAPNILREPRHRCITKVSQMLKH